MLRVRRDCDVAGIPVMGSSLVLSWLIDQEGVMRRSEEMSGGAPGESAGTVICSGRSCGVWRDMLRNYCLLMY